MAPQAHTKQPTTRTTEHQALINSTVGSGNKTEIALDALDSFLLAALCLVRTEEKYADTDEDDKRQALETLLEYARGAVDDGQDGLEKIWHVTAGYLFGQQPETAATRSDKEPAKGKGKAK
jgi:hypothetical protein